MIRFVMLSFLAVILTACSGGNGDVVSQNSGTGALPRTEKPSETAGDAATRQLDFVSKGQWGREWDELHPAHQVIAGREAFATCAQEGRGGAIDEVKVIEIYDDPITVPEIPGTTPAKAVTVELRSGEQKDTITFHEVLVDSNWRWVLPEPALTAYRQGSCP